MVIYGNLIFYLNKFQENTWNLFNSVGSPLLWSFPFGVLKKNILNILNCIAHNPSLKSLQQL